MKLFCIHFVLENTFVYCLMQCCFQILNESKSLLLWCAAPDGVIRLKSTKLREKNDEMIDFYFRHQKHNSLLEYIQYKIVDEKQTHLLSQVKQYNICFTHKSIFHIC